MDQFFKIKNLCILMLATAVFQACAESKPEKKSIRGAIVAPTVDDSEEFDEDSASGDSKPVVKDIASSPPPETPVEPVKEVQESLKFFSASVHPPLVEWCGSCHKTGAQPPYLADMDGKLSFDEILVSHKMDFADPKVSRLYLKIVVEKHQCPPTLGCDEAGKRLLPLLEEWVKVAAGSMEIPKTQVDAKLTTVAKLLSERLSVRDDSGVPEGSFYFPAESGTLKAPMAARDRKEGEGGKIIATPAGAGNDVNLATATNNAALGTVTFTVNITNPGPYHAVGRVGSPNAVAANNSSFYIKADAGPLLLWDFPGTNNTLIYSKADPTVAGGTPHVFNLTAGTHTFEVRQRQELAELDSFILTSDLTYNWTNFAAALRSYNQMEFDISGPSGVAGAKLTLDIGEYDDKSYIVKNPKLVFGQGKIKVKGLKVLINDKFLPQHATFMGINEEVAAPGKQLSSATLIALKDKGKDEDKFSVTFETIENVP